MAENQQVVEIPAVESKTEKPKVPLKAAANENQIAETTLTENVTKERRIPMKFQDVEPPLPDIWKLGPQVLASLSVSLCSMVVGFASAYTSPALASMKAANSTIVPTLQQESWIGSLMPLCGLFGGIVGGPLIELFGRKTTILATSVPFIGSFILIAMAVNIPMIYIGRSIGGLCVGITSLCLPVYLGETLQPEVRGMLGLLPTTVGNIGMLLSFVAGKFIDWSKLAYFGAALPLPYMILMFVIPETPRWYISKDKPEKARRALQWLRGKDACVTSELNATRYAHREEQKQSKDSKLEMFKKPNLKLIATSLGLMFFQQMSGINAVVFYTVSIFEDAGGSIDSFLSTIIMGIVNFGATFAASLLIDRLGRKVLLYISASAMIVSLSALGAFFYFKNHFYQVDDYGWLPLVSIVTYVIGFSFGYGPIPWLMMGEILPAKIRGASASIVTGFNWSCTFIVTKTFKDLTVLVGEHGTFWIFASLSLLGIFFVRFVVPETRGVSLEDIERKYKGPLARRMSRRMSSLANLKPLPMNL